MYLTVSVCPSASTSVCVNSWEGCNKDNKSTHTRTHTHTQTNTHTHTPCWWSEAVQGVPQSVSINPVAATREVRQWLLPGVTDRANQLPERRDWCCGVPGRRRAPQWHRGDGTRRPVSLKSAPDQMLKHTHTHTHRHTHTPLCCGKGENISVVDEDRQRRNERGDSWLVKKQTKLACIYQTLQRSTSLNLNDKSF